MEEQSIPSAPSVPSARGGNVRGIRPNQVQGSQLGHETKESPAAAMLRLSPDRWILQPSTYGNGSMHVTVPPTARRGRGDSSGATRPGDSMPLMLPSGMVNDGVAMDAHMNDNTKSCRVYSFPAQLLDIIEDEDSLDADAPPPPHAALVNFPTGSASERRARVNPANSNRGKKGSGKGGNPNQQHCVMCGRGTESDNVVIPVQNKQVCTDCDTGVWLYKADNTYFKWCKGCKRFRSIHAFREKLQGLRGATRTTCLPSKCDACRCRGRLGYRAKKEAVMTHFKPEDVEGESGESVPSTGSQENDDETGEGPNKKQKRAIKTMKSTKDVKPPRGRKGKHSLGMQLPLGLTMPMGMPHELSMGMNMGMPLSMMPGGLPLSFHHAMYLQQQQQQNGGSSGGQGEGENRNTNGNGNVPPQLLYNSPFSQQLVECLMKMPMYSGNNNGGVPPPLHSAESVGAMSAAQAQVLAAAQQAQSNHQAEMEKQTKQDNTMETNEEGKNQSSTIGV